MKPFKKLAVYVKDSVFAFENAQASTKEFDRQFKELILQQCNKHAVELTEDELQLPAKELFELLKDSGVTLERSVRTTTLFINGEKVMMFFEPQQKMTAKGLKIVLEYAEF